MDDWNRDRAMEIREQSALTRSGKCRNHQSNTLRLSRIATLSNLATSLSDSKLVGLDVEAPQSDGGNLEVGVRVVHEEDDSQNWTPSSILLLESKRDSHEIWELTRLLPSRRFGVYKKNELHQSDLT